jgi:hypothetical protein
MPQHPNAPRPSPAPRPDLPGHRPPHPWNPPGSRPPSPHGDTLTVTTSTEPEKKRDLTVNKVMAGAGAAATTAVLGSYFGAAGTVAGAALGSVASTLATSLYQHSLDRTRDTLVARIRVRRGGVTGEEQTVRLPRPAFDEQGRPIGPDLDDRRPRRRRWLLAAGATLLVFVVAMTVITGIELVKGSTITGNASGTSVGRVVAPPPAEPTPAESTESPTTAEPTGTPAEPDGAEPSAEPTELPEPTSDPGLDPGTDEVPGPGEVPGTTDEPTPTGGP